MELMTPRSSARAAWPAGASQHRIALTPLALPRSLVFGFGLIHHETFQKGDYLRVLGTTQLHNVATLDLLGGWLQWVSAVAVGTLGGKFE